MTTRLVFRTLLVLHSIVLVALSGAAVGAAGGDPAPLGRADGAVAADTGACCNTLTGECLDGQTACPPDYLFQGVGTDCSPNCCLQPIMTGADNCADAAVHMIDVPPPGAPPLIITISGDDSAATGGDGCVGWDPNHKPYWWESFQIDRCAEVVVDYCCTQGDALPYFDPTNPVGIRRSCACTPDVPTQWLCPSGEGSGAASAVVGRACVDGSSCGARYSAGRLPAGTYYVPFHRYAEDRGNYQVHVTATPCPLAACCLRTPVCRHPDGSLAEDVGGSVTFCPNGDECPVGTTCTPQCAELNEFDCAKANGYWLSPPNLPPEEPAVTDCASGRCTIGSCCAGPAACLDDCGIFPGCVPSDPSTWACCPGPSLCELRGDAFAGGGMCDYPRSPCPACEFEGYGNCQTWGVPTGYPDYWFAPSDRSTLDSRWRRPLPLVAADDFVARGSMLSRVCVEGFYNNTYLYAPTQDCAESVTDEFVVNVYADGPGHRPGALLTSRTALVVYRGIQVQDVYLSGELDLWRAQLVLTNPASPLEPDPIALVPGTCYWIEVSNDPRPIDVSDPPTCDWFWAVHGWGPLDRVGNDHSAAKYGAVDWKPMDVDLAFCLDIPFDAGGCGTALGTCCSCANGGWCAETTFAECDGHGQDTTWDAMSSDCAQVTCSAGPPGNDVCQTVSGDACPDGGTCVGGPAAGSPCGTAADCFENSGCLCQPGGVSLITTVAEEPLFIEYSTNCTTTSPPLACSPESWYCQSNDIWFQYTAQCRGALTIDTCGTVSTQNGGYDSILTVYHDPFNPTVCTCPPDFRNVWPLGYFDDEGCTMAYGGGGVLRSVMTVAEGECFLIRVGGYGYDYGGNDGERGPGILTVRAECGVCEPPAPPEPELIDANPGPGQTLVPAKMNRYLAFRMPDSGLSLAVQVTFKTLPPPWDAWNGRKLFATEPEIVCEVSGIGRGGNCPAGAPRFEVYGLSCGSNPSDFARVWATDHTMYVRHPGIIPGGTYELRAFLEPYCDPTDPNAYSPPLTLTLPRWGDIGGAYDATAATWTAPNGNVGVTTDVTALLSKFANRPGAPGKARADLEPLITDLRINITDVTRCVDAFRGLAFPFTPDGLDPCAAAE